MSVEKKAVTAAGEASASPKPPATRPGEVTVRAAEKSDADALALLCQELLAFYGMPARNQRSFMAHAISAGAFETGGHIEILLAELAGKTVGFLAFQQSFALANCQRSFFIQDLFVTRRARAQGVGHALMRELLGLAEKRGIGQIDWTADPWNKAANEFYERLGALLKSDKTFYRLSGKALSGSVRK